MEFDLLIQNGTVIDGTGALGFPADLGITKGRITAMGDLSTATAGKTIDASERVVCPGFIDIHSHGDFSVLFDNTLPSTIRQGITTAVWGNCGESLVPVTADKMPEVLSYFATYTPPDEPLTTLPWHTFGDYLHHLETMGCVINTAHLVGFGILRLVAGPGFAEREPSPAELGHMQAHVAEAMEAGAFGLSTGLIYAPQVYAETAEVTALAQTAAQSGGLYFTHLRNEGRHVVAAVEETIAIVEQSGCTGGQIAHHKVSGPPYRGLSSATLAAIEKANDRGISITCDQYPYDRGMTSLVTALPPWVHAGGMDRLVERVKRPAIRARLRHEIERGLPGWENWVRDVGFDGIYIAGVKSACWQSSEGLNLTEITNRKGYTDAWETLFELLVEEHGEVVITIASMGEEDIHRIMAHRHTMFGSDAASAAPSGVLAFGKPHPRYYGTYPRILGRYVREKGILSLEEAIRKMTSFPASRLGIEDRGTLREGNWADVVVFDPQTVIDRASYTDPHRFSEGIIHVVVNGFLAVEDERQNGCLPGKVLRRA